LAIVAVIAVVARSPAAEPPKIEIESDEVRQFPYGSYIYQVMFSPDGKLAVTDDQVWDAATGQKLRTLPLPPRDLKSFVPFNLAFSPDSRRVAIHRFNDLMLIDVATGKEVWRAEPPPVHANHYAEIPGLAFTPDGKKLVAARPDQGVVQVLAAATGKELLRFAYDSVNGGLRGAILIGNLGISADGRQLIVPIHQPVIQERGGLAVFDLETGKELARHHVSSEKAWVQYSAPSPDGRHVFYAKENKLHQIDLKTGKELRRFEGIGVYVFHVVCSPDEKYVAAVVREKKDVEVDWIQCWEVATGKTVRIIKGRKGMGGPLAFSPDGKFILSADADKTARLWRVTD
jgi:WD40 repeat protein